MISKNKLIVFILLFLVLGVISGQNQKHHSQVTKSDKHVHAQKQAAAPTPEQIQLVNTQQQSEEQNAVNGQTPGSNSRIGELKNQQEATVTRDLSKTSSESSGQGQTKQAAQKPKYQSASFHLNQALDFDTQSLMGQGGLCPSLKTLSQVEDWLYAWLDLLDDPSDLESDVVVLKAVKGLIYGAKQHILLANGLPAEFAESMKKLKRKKSNYIQIIYGAEMSQVYAQVHLMETFESVQKSLALCQTIIKELDYLIDDVDGILSLKEDYPEYICAIKQKIAEIFVMRRDCYEDDDNYQLADGTYDDDQDGTQRRVRTKKSDVKSEWTPRERERKQGEDDDLNRDVVWDEQGDGLVKEQALSEKELKSTRQAAFSLYFRWSANTPRQLEDWNVFHKNNACQQIARITESEGDHEGEIGDRFLTVLICPKEDGNLVLRFAGYDLKNENWSVEHDFDTTYEELDGQWIWIYFGYQQQLKKSICGAFFTESDRWVFFEFNPIEKRNFKTIKLFKFLVGGSHGLEGINALFSQTLFDTFRGAYKETQEQIKALYGKKFKSPTVGVFQKQSSQEVEFEDVEGVDQIGSDPKLRGFGMKYAGATKYSLRGWWWFDEPISGGEDQHSVIWITGNNPERGKFGNGNNWEDVLFVIYLTRSEIRVCSYSIGANGLDDGQKQVCNVQLIQGARGELWWMYTYISYNRATKSLYALLRIEGQNYEFRRNALHLKVGYIGLWYLQDPTRAGFKGSAKKFAFAVGDKANTDNLQEALAFGGESPEPKDGQVDISNFTSLKSQKFALRLGEKEPLFQADLPPSIARLATEFRIEFWIRISVTNPDRVTNGAFMKEGCRQIARAYEGFYNANEDNGKKDRMLAIFYCAGASYQYKFYTYYENVPDDSDLNGYSINAEFTEIEGSWNYVYMGYDSKINTAFAGVYFPHTDRLADIKVRTSRPRGKPNKIGFVLGAGFGHETVNGEINKPDFRWDEEAYLSSIKEIEENIDGQSTLPEPDLPLKLRWRLIGDGEDLTAEIFPIPVEELDALDGEQSAAAADGEAETEGAQEDGEGDGEQDIYFDGEQEEGLFRDMRHENSGADEWAFFGWFKFTVPKRMPQIPVTVLRAVFNDPRNGELKVSENFGDNVASLFITSTSLELCTGNTGEAITDKVNPKDCVNSNFGNDLEAWIWFYMGYSRKEESVRYYIQYEDRSWNYVNNEVIHIIPHWSAVYLGGDPFLSQFRGYMHNVEAFFGPRSFLTGNLDHLIESSAPLEVRLAMMRAFGDDLAFILVESRAKSSEYVYKLELPPNLLDDVYSVSYSFWFRLSTQIPEKILDISFLQEEGNEIMLARAFDCEISDFDSREKERFLSVWVDGGKIVFGAFDEAEQELRTADGEMPFSELEGSWNWVYIGLNFEEARVTGAQYNLDNKKWQFRTIQDVHKDNPLEYLKFITGRSFGVDTINGHFYDVRFDFEENTLLEKPKDIKRFFEKVIPTPTAFIGSEEIISLEVSKEGDEYFELNPARPPIIQTTLHTEDIAPGTYRAVDLTEELKNNIEYCVYGWFKFEEPQIRRDSHLVLRLTNNNPNGNYDYEGDSTLSVIIRPNTLDFVTYNIADIIGFENHPREPIEVDPGNDIFAWVFFYFGYERNSQAYSLYVRFQDHTEKVAGQALHFTPNLFNIWLGDDDHNDQFKGYMRGITVEAGNGSYRPGDVKDLIMKNLPDEIRAAFDAANGKDQEGILVATNIYSKQSTYTLEIPPELVEENQAYTFAMWTKFSFVYPVRVFELDFLTNNQELVIGRFANCELEDEDNRKTARFAALIWRRGDYILQVFDESSGTLLETDPIHVDVAEIESRWVWSIVSYSTVQDKAVLGLYFAETDRWEVHELAAVKNLPLQTLKFQAGPSFGHRSINGLFFDTRFEFEFFENEEAVRNFFDTEVNFPSDYHDKSDSNSEQDGESEINLLAAEAFFDATLSTPSSIVDMKEKFSGMREYAVRGWFKFQGDELSDAEQALDRLVFRFTINNPAKYEFNDDTQLGDRMLSLIITKKGDLLFDSYSYNNDWSVGNERNLEYRQGSSNDLYSWMFVYFGMNIDTRTLAWHVRFADHVKSKVFKDVYHFIPSWLGLYLAKDPFTQPFHGKMSNFQVLFGKGSFISSGFRRLYDPRPPELVVDLSKITGNDFEGKYLRNVHSNRAASYVVDLPPELLEDVTEYELSFWFRHSANVPEENLRGWDEMFKRCLGLFRIRETEEGNAEYLGDRSAMISICPTRDGKINVRATTYDVESDNANLFFDEPILFSELEGTWLWFYAGYSKTAGNYYVHVRVPRTDRDISITIPAKHHEDTEQVYLEIGYDGYVNPLQGTYYDIRFDWGPDGEYKANAQEALAFFEKDYQFPEEDVFEGTESKSKLVNDDWTFDSRTQSDNPHFVYNDEFDNAEDYAVYGWHRWSFNPEKSSWYLIYRLHTNQNPSNAEQLGDRTLSLWIGDNVYHPATYNTADATRVGDPNAWTVFNYDERDLLSWTWTHYSYSRNLKKAFFYFWSHGRSQTFVKENIVHFVPNFFGFYLGKDPWHRSFHGRLMQYNVVFGPGAYKEDGFDSLRQLRGTEIKPRDPVVTNVYRQDYGKEERKIDIEYEPYELADVKQYGFSLYFRWSQRVPRHIRDPYYYLSQCFTIARFTESSSDRYTVDRSLGFWYCPHYRNPGILFQTYRTNGGLAHEGRHIPFNHQNLDGSWNYIHVSYSKADKKAVMYMNLGITGQEIFEVIEGIEHYDDTGYLRFIVGPYFHQAAPGYYFGLNFGINQGIYAATKDEVLAYKKQQPQPPAIESPYSLNPVIEEFSLSMHYPDVDLVEYGEPAENAMEYAVFGHYKWTPPPSRGSWHLLFRLSSTEKEVFHNANSLGDRDLSVWVHESNFIHFTTYDFAENSNVNLWQNQYFNYNEFANKWFFIYYGYSRRLNKAVWYLKFESSEYRGEMNCVHFVPTFLHLRPGKDEWHYAWNGDIQHLQVAIGPGAFRTEKYNELMALKVKLFSDEDEYQGKPEFSAGTDENGLDSFVNRGKPVIEHEFNMDEEEQCDYSFSFYFQNDHRKPGFLHLYYLRHYWKQLAGITRKGRNLWWTGDVGDRTLGIWVWPIHYYLGYHFCTYNNDGRNVNDCQNIQTSFDEFELGWTWFYFGYSIKRQKAYAVIQQGMDKKYFELMWPGRRHTKKPGVLQFHVGSDGDWAANGQFFDVRLDYGKGSYFGNLEDLQAYQEQFVPAPPLAFATQFKDVLLTKEEFWIGRSQSNDDLNRERRFDYEGLDVLEYAVHGWYRWIGWKPDTWNNLFRLTTNEPQRQGNADYIGDRDLAVWNGPGYLHYTTSTYQYNHGDNWNVVQNIDYSNKNWDLATFQWIYVYFGYNRKTQTCTGFLKLGSVQETTIKFTGIRHQVAKFFRIYIGKDPWHQGTYGVVRDWHFTYGPGSYREDNFDQLYNVVQKIKVRENFNKQAAHQLQEYKYEEAYHTNQYRFEIPQSELADALEYSYSFWFKFTWWPGTTDFGRMRSWWHSLAGFSESGSYAPAGWGDRNLAIWFIYWGASVGFHATTYDYYCNWDCGNSWKNFEGLNMKDVQNSWTRIYFGYSHTQRSAFAHFYLERPNRSFHLEWPGILHRHPLERLYFLLGGLPHQAHGTPALYRNIRVDWKKGSFVNNDPDIQKYFELVSPQPTVFPVLDYTPYPLVEDKPFVVGRNDGSRRFVEASQNAGAEEYAWWGWFQWEEPSHRDTWHIIFRLSLMENHIDASYLGDRTLNLWLNPNGEYLHFSTFNVRHNGGDDTNRWQNMAAPYDDYSRWFWVYFGYNYAKEKAYAYVKFNSGVRTLEWNVHHVLPVYTTWYLCKDAWYAGFAGRVRKVTMAFGKGAYKENQFDELQKFTRTGSKPQQVIFEDNEKFDKYQSQYYQNVDPVINHKIEDIDDYNVTDYSFSLWFKANMYAPVRLDLDHTRRNNQFLGGISENGECAGGRYGDRSLCIFESYWNGGNNLQWLTYDLRSQRASWGYNLPYDWTKDYDNQWNFIYFGYSLNEKRAFGYIQYSRSQSVQTLNWPDCFHINPLQRVFFQLGKTTSYKHGLNGFFAQVRLNFQEKSFLGSQEQVEKYMNDVYKLPLTKAKFDTVQLVQEELEINGSYDNQYQFQVEMEGGAEEYALYGWFKGKRSGEYWTNLFRVSANQNYGNADYVGDRDLAAWISWPNSAIALGSYQIYGDDWNRWVWAQREDTDLEDWFWVYAGYSWAKKKMVLFIRYNDHERIYWFDSHNQYIPHRMFIELGQDKFYTPLRGTMKEVYFSYGIGAFREANFVELHKTPIEGQNLGDVEVGYGRNRAVYDVEAPIDDLQSITEYSFSFYFRANYLVPERVHPGWIRGQWLGIAGMTDSDGDYCGGGWGDRALGLFNWPWSHRAGYHFTTYNYPHNSNQHQQIDYHYSNEFDSSWNFIYFGFSDQVKKVFAFVRFGRTQRVATLSWNSIGHFMPPRKLRYLIGRCGGVNQLTGMYNSIQFNYQNGAFIDDENILLNSYMGDQRQPTAQIPNRQLVVSETYPGKTVQISRDQTYDKSRNFLFNDAVGAQEYSFYGWNQHEGWKSRGTDLSGFNLIGRLTWSENTGNADWWNDRILLIFQGPWYLQFSTYNYCQNGCDDFNNAIFSNDFGDDIYQWYFIHFSYSFKDKQAIGYVRYDNGKEQEIVFNGFTHFVPEKLVFMQGKNYWHQGFQGYQTGYNVAYGPGAFRQGMPSFLEVMYRNNPQSAQIRIVEARTQNDFLLLAETKINESACETCFDTYLSSGQYEVFNEQASKIENQEIQHNEETIAAKLTSNSPQSRARRN